MILAFLFRKEVHMQVQDISLTQIVVVLLFLGTLILLQQLLKNNKCMKIWDSGVYLADSE